MGWDQCGRNGAGRLLISGSDDPTLAQPGEFPHMCVIYRSVSLAQSDRQPTVVLLRVQAGQRVYIGGASLIAPNKLLTVAHKFWVV